MKKILIGLALLSAFAAQAQSYEDQMNKAGEALQKKDFCSALAIFQTAFRDSAKIGTYDLAYAAVAAANCKAEKEALNWLKQSQKKGLGLNSGEIDFIANDSNFINLRSYSEWQSLLADMKNAFTEKLKQLKQKEDTWVKAINDNRIALKQKRQFKATKSGFALYFSEVDNFKVPYLVYIPKIYKPTKPIQAIVYLHGGIVNTEDFNFQNPDLGTSEPIFAMGDAFNTIVIYPFGKRDFGWVAQKKAFENVLTIIDKVQLTYNIDAHRIFLGGMSNGGSATFWFATQKPNIFKGFYALSALPKLEIGEIDFKNIAQNKPFYSLNAKDDDVFKYDDVFQIYQNQQAMAKDWRFNALPAGGHGFIYQANGLVVLKDFLGQLILEKK